MERKRYKQHRSIVTKVSVTAGLLILVCTGGILYYYSLRTANFYRRETELYAGQTAWLAAATISESLACGNKDAVLRVMKTFTSHFQEATRITAKSAEGEIVYNFHNRDEQRKTVSATADVVVKGEKLGSVEVEYPFGDFIADTRERRFASFTEIAASSIHAAGQHGPCIRQFKKISRR